MSFSAELKKELSQIENLSNKELIKYELAGYLLSSNITKSKNKIKFVTESEYNINRFAKLLNNMNILKYDINIIGKKFYIELNCKEVEKITLDLEEDLKEENAKALFRGIFLGAGYINNPQKDYHLEINVINDKTTKYIQKTLEKFNIKIKILENSTTLYIKEGEEISKFLAFIGANRSVLKFEEIRVSREMSNKVNRIVNCGVANLNKIINASVEQVEAIKKLQASNKFDTLDEKLKEVAEVRLENPNASLNAIRKDVKRACRKIWSK